jgi:hypothetical protein
MSNRGHCEPCIVASAPLNLATGATVLVVDGVVQAVAKLSEAVDEIAEEPTKPWRTALESAVARDTALRSALARPNIRETIQGSLKQQFTSADEGRVARALNSSQESGEQQAFPKQVVRDIETVHAEARRLVDDLYEILGGR